MKKLQDYRELDGKIKELIEEDVNNPEIYETIKLLVFYWLLRTKKVFKKADAEIIASDMAGDLYMKVLDGKVIYSWIHYINSVYLKYVKAYKENNYKQFFNVEGDPEAIFTMAELFSGSMNLSDFDQVSFHEIGNVDFIRYIPKFIEELTENESRYCYSSSQTLNLRLSLLISLIRSEPEVFRLPETELNYVKYFMGVFETRVKEDLEDMSSGGKCLLSEKELISYMFKPYLADGGDDDEE